MKTITVRNVNGAYPLGAQLLLRDGEWQATRYGRALVHPEPVTTHYEQPTEKVLFDTKRDANPFFHVMESLWMLAGRADVAWLAQWLDFIKTFSDDGLTFHGAYGARWRYWPVVAVKQEEEGVVSEGDPLVIAAMDQLEIIIRLLQENPNDRRLVLAMWDPAKDLDIQSKDIPCNDLVKFRVIDGALCMIVFNRSNDIIWGAYGANAVHMAFLLEYVAGRAGLPVGWYEQISSDFHAYEEPWTKHEPYLAPSIWDPYQAPVLLHTGKEDVVKPIPFVTVPDQWDADNKRFLAWCCDAKRNPQNYANDFFNEVAEPLAVAHQYWRDKHKKEAVHTVVNYVGATDWALATYLWMERRINKRSI